MTNCGITDLVLKDCPKMVFLHGRCSARAAHARAHTHAHTHTHTRTVPRWSSSTVGAPPGPHARAHTCTHTESDPAQTHTHTHTHTRGRIQLRRAHTHTHSDPAHSSRASQMLQPRRRVFQRVRRLEFLRSVLVPRFSATDSMALARDQVPRRGPAFTRPPSSFLQVTASA